MSRTFARGPVRRKSGALSYDGAAGGALPVVGDRRGDRRPYAMGPTNRKALRRVEQYAIPSGSSTTVTVEELGGQRSRNTTGTTREGCAAIAPFLTSEALTVSWMEAWPATKAGATSRAWQKQRHRFAVLPADLSSYVGVSDWYDGVATLADWVGHGPQSIFELTSGTRYWFAIEVYDYDYDAVFPNTTNFGAGNSHEWFGALGDAGVSGAFPNDNNTYVYETGHGETSSSVVDLAAAAVTPTLESAYEIMDFQLSIGYAIPV